jgi:ribonuclease Z
MARVTFLGTGGAFSAGRRSNPALLIEADGFRMLVEAGPTIMPQLVRAGLKAAEIERLFVTHPHGDHTLGFPMLVLNRLGDVTPLHIYAGATTIAALKTLWTTAYPHFDGERFVLEWHALPEDAPARTELAPGVTLRSVDVPYPPGVPTLAARWNFVGGPSVAYVTDTYPCATTLELARGCDLLIHEASFSAVLQPETNPADHFHSTARQAGELARAAGCPRLALVHLGPDVGEHPDALAEEARAGSALQVIVPEDGERIQVG